MAPENNTSVWLISDYSAVTNFQICKSDEENLVYRNLYGSKDYNYSFVQTLGKLTTGFIEFIKEGHEVLAKKIKDTTPESNLEYDFIVVGAGSAGSTIAARLSEIGNVKVLLIEAGREENLVYDIPVLSAYLQFSYLVNWRYKTDPANTYCLGMKEHSCKLAQGRGMGGSSVLNDIVATRGHPLDYDNWASMGNTGWSYNELLKYFKKLEEIFIPELREDKKFHNTEGPLPISYPSFHTPLAEAFLKAGEEMGYPIIDYNGEKRIGYSYIQTVTKNGERISTNRAYLHPIRKRKNLFVSKNSHVNKVLIDQQSKRAYGVEFTKFRRNIRVKARKEIILCAGAIGSPKLLMLSGVGPSDHLKDMKIETIQDAPVGKNLIDHLIYVGLVFLVDQPVSILTTEIINPLEPYLIDYLKKRDGPFVTSGAEAIAFINTEKPNNLDAYPDVELLFLGGSFASIALVRLNYGGISDEYWDTTFANISGRYSWTIFTSPMHPLSRGELLLTNKNPKSKPKLIANYFNDPKDLKVMVKGIRAAIEISKTQAMQRFKSQLHVAPIPGCERNKYDSDEYWECAARTYSASFYHQVGTCKMAPENDTSGVVNPRLQVKGIKGLRVGDASIMPTHVAAHTNIPTIMIAEKLADMIKEDWGFSNEK